VSSQTTVPTSDTLQLWANDPEAARANLTSIFVALDSDESLAAWATEALENCGSPLETDIEFLSRSCNEHRGDVAYWACKLIGRLGPEANEHQKELTAALQSNQATEATRQQAAIALGKLGALNEATRQALNEAAQSKDPRLSRLAQQSLESTL